MIKYKILVKSPPWPTEEVDKLREKVLKTFPSSLLPKISSHPDLPGRMIVSLTCIEKIDIEKYLDKLEIPIEDIIIHHVQEEVSD